MLTEFCSPFPDKPESEETPMEQADDSSSKTAGSGDGESLICQVSKEASMESEPSEIKSEQKSESENRTGNHTSQNVTTDTKMDASTDKDTTVNSNGSVVAGAGVQESGGEAVDAKVDKGELIDLKVMYNKKKYDVRVGNESTVAELKTEVQTTTG